MIDNKKVTAIILAAGNSLRFGQNRNKNFELINENAVLSYSLKAFLQNSYIDDIIIAAKDVEVQTIEDIIKKESLPKEINIIMGGSTRKLSVYNCIKHSESDIVIIQDAARPMITQVYINECLEAMRDFKGVTMGVKSKDTIKIANKDNVVISTTERSNTWIIQTPQCFDRKILLQMHETCLDEEITDDCMLLEKGGFEVKIIEGDYSNIKITTYDDLNIIKTFLKQ